MNFAEPRRFRAPSRFFVTRLARLFALTVGAVLALGGRASAANDPVIIVLDAEPRKLPSPHSGTDLAAQLKEGLEGAGCTVPRVCRGGDCGSGVLGDATHVLTFTGRYEANRFACSLSDEARHPGGGVVEYRAFTDNPVCPITQMIKDTRDAGRRACEELRRFAAGGATTSGPSDPTASGAAGPTATAGATAAAAPAPAGSTSAFGVFPPPRARPDQVSVQRPSLLRRSLGPGLIMVGAGVGALGVYQLTERNDLTNCHANAAGQQICTGSKSRPLALPLLLLGAAGIGLGIWDIVQISMASDGSTMAISAGGRF